ncbi:MAG TPA: ribulose-phosphate 3-epimerase [Chloroflexi bacterium]|nr:ribulose-phosphate 3-epimerase [Chloroflexota bacterium]
MITIEASILSADFARLGEQAREAQAGGADAIQIDVMDGRFVPPITFGASVVRALRRAVDLPLDVHLMIVEPGRHLETFAEAGADRIIVHQEATLHIHYVLKSIRELGIEVGVSINPGTSVFAVEEILDMVDMVQIMTVDPGWGGQPFLHSQMEKIRRLRRMIDERGLDVFIGVDGGIDEQTAPLVVEAGATMLVSGSGIYNDRRSVAENLAALRASSI